MASRSTASASRSRPRARWRSARFTDAGSVRGVERERAPVRRDRLCFLGAGGVEAAELGLRLGTVGVELQRCQVLVQRLRETRAVLRGETRLRHAHEAARRLDAHHPHRIGEQSRQQPRTERRIGVANRDRDGKTHQRVAIARRLLECRQRRASRVPDEPGDRARARDRRHGRIGRERRERGLRAGRAAIAGGERLGKGLLAGLALRVPARDGVGRPLRALLRVAVAAGVRRAERNRPVGPRDAHRVVVPWVDHHVGRRRHVARRARRAGRAGLVPVMGGRVEARRRVALRAHRVARHAQLLAVRVVAVGAGDALRVHAALQERAVVVDLVAHLPVGVVEIRLEQRDTIGVAERRAGMPGVVELAAPRVASRAGLDLAARGSRRGARRVAGRGVDRPRDAAPLVQCDREPLRCIGPACIRVELRPRDVVRARAVTGLAADVDLGPGRPVGAGRVVVVLAQVGRVAVGALVVPVLVDAGPVQRVAGLELAIRVEVEPALPALCLGTRVPGDAERLQSPPGQLDQVLLQRMDAERVLDLEVGERAVRSVGVDEEPTVATEEAGRDAGVREARVGEVAEHRLLGRLLHRAVVMRAAPRLVFLGVTARARRGTNVARGRSRRRLRPDVPAASDGACDAGGEEERAQGGHG